MTGMDCLTGQQSRNFSRFRTALNCDHVSSPTDVKTQGHFTADYVRTAPPMGSIEQALHKVRQAILAAGFSMLEYLKLRADNDLAPIDALIGRRG
ncbi:hypothetical protein [Mesorhizobium sp.]|nr:hypothetical protein [Mesorhizobium sp.]